MTRRLLRSALAVLFLLLISPHSPLRSADLVISELMALNSSTVRDDDGDFSDWFEIHNAGAEAANLAGWYATDDSLELTKWQFPEIEIDPGGFLVVFASDKDRRLPGSELHTNFKLTSRGEYLALVEPDGHTIAWEYLSFPPLLADFSYGLRMDASFEMLVADGGPARARVPDSGDSATAASLAWTLPSFDDSSWFSGTQGVGYEHSSGYQSLIGIDLESLMYDVNTTAWIRIPFSIADPADVERMELRVKYDDGFIAYINGVEVQAAQAPASPAAWNAGATSDHTDSAALVFESWSFSAAGLLEEGENILAIHGLNHGSTSSDFLIIAELEGRGGGSLERDVREYFNVPTPGFGNTPGFPGVSPEPVFSVSSCVFQGTLQVALSVPAPEAEIRYTLDRSVPTESSPVYAGPIALSSSRVVYARSFAEGLSPSPIASEAYLRIDASLAGRTSEVPLVIVETFGGAIPDTSSTTFGPAFMAIFDVKEDGLSRLSNAPDIAQRIGIKERGSSSAGRPKKSYRFEFWDEHDEDLDVEPLGLPRESDWILYGAYNFDHTHMRNPFIYELSRQVGPYAARTRFIEVFLSTSGGNLTSANYWGVYSLMESIKRGRDRVDIERLDRSVTTEPDIQGGYIIKKDRVDPGGSGSFTAGGVDSLQFVYPDVDYVNTAQRNWIRDHLSVVFTTADFWSYIEPVVAIDHHILNAMPKNVDAFRLSGYLFKPRFGRVEFGPIWDFDRSMDSTDGRDNAYNTWEGTGDSSLFFSYDSRTPFWYRWLQTADFLQLWKDRWYELRQGPMDTASVQAIIDRMTGEIRQAAIRDQAKWNQTTNWLADVTHLRTWLTNRILWIDSQFARPPSFFHDGVQIDPRTIAREIVAPGYEVTVTAPAGTIFCTLDGSDPRLAGGGLSPIAQQYTAPIAVDANSRLVARARISTTNWSAPAAATFVTETPRLVISEMMYHPFDPLPSSPFDAEDFEFVELVNTSAGTLDLSGFRFTAGIEFVFSPDEPFLLERGEYAIIVSNLEAFSTRYDPTGIRIAGQYAGLLNNAGDQIRLEGPLGEPIHDFTYSDLWYPATDGDGDSLNIYDPWDSLSLWESEESWAPSSVVGGTPGREDPGLSSVGGRQRPSDSNQDGAVDLSDAISLLIRLFTDGSLALPCEGMSLQEGGNLLLLDASGDASVDVSDAIYLLNYLFLDGPPPSLGSDCIRIEGCPSACSF